MIRTLSSILLLTLATVSATADGSSPNVLLILSDDQGYGDLSHHGNPVLETPVLDQLFEEGLEMTRFYVSPVCSPTRASLLTGRYHHRTGVCGVFQGEDTMRQEEVTLAEIFKAAGYATGCFGKWHNGSHWPETPRAQGFEEFFGFTAGVIYTYQNPVLLHNGSEAATNGYITDILTDRALQFIETSGKAGKPFFCYIPYNVPHKPVRAPEKLINKYRLRGLDDFTAGIYAMLENMDANIGRLLVKLEQLGIADDTIVIFLSDNGPNSLRYNSGLKGKKGQYHEGGVRVPFVIRWPGGVPGQRKADYPAAHIDLLPTLAELCGFRPLKTAPLDGINLACGLVRGDFPNPDRLIYSFPYIRREGGLDTLPGGLRNKRWAAIKTWEGEWTLYDLIADPGQKTNLAATHPDVLQSMKTSYQQKFRDVTREGLEPAPVQMGIKGHDRILLKAGNGFLAPEGAGIQFNYQRFPLPGNWVTHWTDSAAYLYWPVLNHRAGTYSVRLHYALQPTPSGVGLSFGSGDQRIHKTLTAPAASPLLPVEVMIPEERQKYALRTWASLEIGELQLPAGGFQLSLKPGEPWIGKALEIKAVELVRSAD